MTAIISSNELDSIEVVIVSVTEKHTGDKIIFGDESQIDSLYSFLEKNGIYGISFDPSDDVEKFKNYSEMRDSLGRAVGFRLFN